MMRWVATVLAGLAALITPSVMAQSPFTSDTRYDSNRQIVGTIASDPDGAGGNGYLAVRNTYDSGGRLIKVETGVLLNWQSPSIAPASWSDFTVHTVVEATFDNQSRKTTETKKGSDGVAVSLVQYSYDPVGRLECTAVRMNPAAYGSLPASACTLGSEGSFGPDRIMKNIYDPASRLLKVQKAYATTLQEDYATYAYSPNGKRTSLTDARGYKASMTYDGYDRQARWYFPSPTTTGLASTTDYEEYGYDANGNRTSLRKRDGSIITYQFDALNRNTAKVVPERSGLAATHTRDVYYGYDLMGLQTYARFDSAAATSEGLTASYDGVGRLASSLLTMDGVTRTLSYGWDKNGNRIELTWPDAAKTSYSYDGLDRMTTLFEGALGSTTNMVGHTYNDRGLPASQTGRYSQMTTWSYDAAGRPNALSHGFPGTVNDVAFTFGYTPGSQLQHQSRDNDAYVWNAHYNVDRIYTANGLNQYTSAGSAAFTYDLNGNLVSDGVKNYIYDVENRLVWMGTAGGSAIATLRYDPLGRLYETVGGGNTTRFLHDGVELVAEYDGSGTLLRRYAHGKKVDDPVVWYEGAGTTSPRWLHTDHQGSVIAVTDATGSAIAINAYDEYGIPKVSNLGRFQYTGQAWIPELGMNYYKARIYSPTLGRFMQTDPIGYADQVNLYAYVASDPVNNTDPDGQECQSQTGSRVCRTQVENRDPMWRLYTPGKTLAKAAPNNSGRSPSAAGQGAGNPVDDAVEVGVNSIDAAAARMRENRGKGRTGEEVARSSLIKDGNTILGSQVYVRDTQGRLRIVDFIVAGGPNGMMGVEVKYGSAVRSNRQKTIDFSLNDYGGTVRSRNQPGLFYGQRVRFYTTEIHVQMVPSP